MEALEKKRLVLGFDAGCTTCSQLAERIEEAAGEKLEMMSLSESCMREWRGQALGKDAPWAPTLVEVGDGKVRAWTGVKMGGSACSQARASCNLDGNESNRGY